MTREPKATFERTLLWIGSLCALTLLFLQDLPAATLPLPGRPTNAPGGTELITRLTPLPLPEREVEIVAQVLSRNVPDFLRNLAPVSATNAAAGTTNRATYYVIPDYLAVGSDSDYFLTPLSPNAAQRIADALNCVLPTRKMVNDIYSTAAVRLAPIPIPPSPAMTTVPVFSNHNSILLGQRSEQLKTHPLGALVAGHKKDLVVSPRLAAAPGKVAIYGWHQTNGAPIQPLYLGHTANWVDYSQCIRLVANRMIVDGEITTVSKVLANPALAGLLSDEGVIQDLRYPTNALKELPPGVVPPASGPVALAAFKEARPDQERTASFTLDPELKVHVNAPSRGTLVPGKKLLLIFYALPNGNTTEQTIGKSLKPGDDWHYDIQHIGAQTRFLRELLPERPIIVAYLESNIKSWPAWRKKNGDKLIPGILRQIENIFAGNELEIVLNGHSGGGSLIFGYLNALDSIPDKVNRIAFLDSNYAYDSGHGHEQKLAHWLKANDRHFLCVLAYNDAVALLEGKSFVSAAGGTWGKSHEMQRDLARDFKFDTEATAEFENFSALEGRLQFILKENPERKIFHTVQVERNGFIHSIVSGTTNENKGYEYFGPRAYSKWIRPGDEAP